MFLLTGENQTFSYQFRYKDFWKSLTTEPEDKLSGKKADFMVMQQILKAAEQVCEKELHRRKWQIEYNMKTAQQKQRWQMKKTMNNFESLNAMIASQALEIECACDFHLISFSLTIKIKFETATGLLIQEP